MLPRGALAGCLVVGSVAAGCAFSGGPIRFSEPAGGTVRVGAGFSHEIPWQSEFSKGMYEVVISPHGRQGFLGLSAGKDAVKGWLVVLESWKGAPAEFLAMESGGYSDGGGPVNYATGSTPDGRTAFRFKGTTEGVPKDDGEVQSWSGLEARSWAGSDVRSGGDSEVQSWGDSEAKPPKEPPTTLEIILYILLIPLWMLAGNLG